MLQRAQRAEEGTTDGSTTDAITRKGLVAQGQIYAKVASSMPIPGITGGSSDLVSGNNMSSVACAAVVVQLCLFEVLKCLPIERRARLFVIAYAGWWSFVST